MNKESKVKDKQLGNNETTETDDIVLGCMRKGIENRIRRANEAASNIFSEDKIFKKFLLQKDRKTTVYFFAGLLDSINEELESFEFYTQSDKEFLRANPSLLPKDILLKIKEYSSLVKNLSEKYQSIRILLYSQFGSDLDKSLIAFKKIVEAYFDVDDFDGVINTLADMVDKLSNKHTRLSQGEISRFLCISCRYALINPRQSIFAPDIFTPDEEVKKINQIYRLLKIIYDKLSKKKININ